MLSKTAKGLLSRFLTYTEQEVLDAFASLQGATVTKDYVYVPGTRSDRILLVAHADTVNQRGTGKEKESPPRLMWMGDAVGLRRFWHADQDNKNVYGEGWFSYNHQALGADDRAGCAMLWQFKENGHSVLITTGEESGLYGARAAVRQLRKELESHTFALEVDRRGDRQAVFYDVSTEPFRKYMLSLLSASDPENEEWLEYNGSSTDIKHICDEVRICGVNVSAGYLGEHGESEMLFLEAWLHTHDTVKKVLAAEHERWSLPAKPAPTVHTHSGAPDRLCWRWCAEHICYMDKCVELHETAQKPTVVGSKDLTSLNSKIGKQYKVRIFRVKGEKAGEGTLELRLAVAGRKDVLGECPQSLSKRQAKKLAKVIVHMLGEQAVNNDEATKLLNEVIRLRDVKPQDIKPVTEAQRERHAAGETADYYPADRQAVVPAAATCKHGMIVGNLCHQCPSSRATGLVLVVEADQYEDVLAHPAAAAVALAESAARKGAEAVHQELSPATSKQLVQLAAAEQSPLQNRGVFDDSTNRCWHSCGHCKQRWYHLRVEADSCRLSFGCFCPTDGSPTVYEMINHARWGYISDTRSHLKVETGSKVSERVACSHNCSQCKGPWKHIKPTSGKCDVGGYDTHCPIHSVSTYKAVAKYEETCKLPGWASCLHRQYELQVSEDPNDASSNEPAKGDVMKILTKPPLLMDGKTGSGLKVDSQREGEL